MVKIVDDPFTEGSTTPLESHTPNNAGDGWTEEEDTSIGRVLQAVGGAGHAASSEVGNNSHLTYSAQPNPADSATTEYDVSITFSAFGASDDTSFGMIARWTDNSNMYIAALRGNANPTNEIYSIHKIIAGVPTEVAVGPNREWPGDLDSGDELIFKVRCVIQGDQLRITIDYSYHAQRCIINLEPAIDAI